MARRTLDRIPLDAAFDGENQMTDLEKRLSGLKMDDTNIENTNEVIGDVTRAFHPKDVLRELRKGDHYDKLLRYSREVLPLHRTCPYNWSAQTRANKKVAKEWGVLVMNDDGNFCAPDGDLEAEYAVDADKKDDVDMDIAKLTRKIVMMLPAGDKLRERADAVDSARKEQKAIRIQNLEAEKVEVEKQYEKQLMKIFKNMDAYSGKTKEQLQADAKAYLTKAKQCAAANMADDPEKACDDNDGCSGIVDPTGRHANFCVPEQLQSQVSVLESQNGDVDPEEAAQVGKLSRWWTDYYLNYYAQNKGRREDVYDMLTPGHGRSGMRSRRSARYGM